ncbi:MurR/RpiR family transcriptional regulator [Vibrio salinus]|uniref:MurR/RpiR family transcriptional regulator n=1 Tax=Vibrio salinus TaxID=2899784 RepID=UPI001E424AFD|nr:MurR/RpiR family transcriptional regulator [Vibrio salinus]MCE0493686.1 MurR/RpiR family transcriptional regulator [Vibrio salinus]
MQTATNLTELQDQIRERYSQLSKRLKQVAEYVLDNAQSTAFDTVAVIADNAGVPPSTLIRFANAFGYSGFNEMKQLFRKNLLEETTSYTDRVRLLKELDEDIEPADQPSTILHEFSRANSQAMHNLALQIAGEDLSKAVDLLVKAKSVHVIGLGRSFSVASYLAYALRHLNNRVFLVDGLGGMFREQVNMIESEDVLIAVSFTPYAKEAVIATEAASKVGAKQLIITDSQISPLASMSDICFYVKEAEVDGFRSQAASMCLAQTLAVSLAFQVNDAKK